MTTSELATLVDYHYGARDRMLAAIEPLSTDQFTRELGNSFSSVRDTGSHLHGAEWVLLSRLQGEAPTALLPHQRFPDLAAARGAWAESEAGVRALVAGLDAAGLDRTLDYRLLNGAPGSSRVWHIVQHLVNHATYHRGQVTTMLRQLGAASPRPQDLIAFYRERGA